jgi:putative transposase
MPQAATIKSLPAAFRMIKAMQADDVEWGEDYRGAARQAQVGELTMTAELLEAKIERLEGGPGGGRAHEPRDLALHEPSLRHPAGGPTLGTSRATLHRQRRRDLAGSRRRPGPIGPMTDEALVEAIRELLAASPFHGEGHRKVWARLRFAGIRSSRRRVLRLMREHGLLAPSRVGRPHGPRAHDGTIRTERVDAMWGTDLTSTMTGEGQASIFVTVDHCSTECVGIHAARRATRFEALEPLRQGVRACFGAFGAGVASGLSLRHDHGSQFIADDYQRELTFLSIASSPAFVREPEGNGCAERFIRTLKENLLWVRRFDTVEESPPRAPRLPGHLHRTWIVERHGYQTPAAIRGAQLAPLPAAA